MSSFDANTQELPLQDLTTLEFLATKAFQRMLMTINMFLDMSFLINKSLNSPSSGVTVCNYVIKYMREVGMCRCFEPKMQADRTT